MITSTFKELELANGEKVKLTLNFRKLYELKNKRKDIYNRYNQIQMNGTKEVLDFTLILYTAYLCALEDVESAMTEEEFLEVLPPYESVVVKAAVNLQRPKKETASDELSGEM